MSRSKKSSINIIVLHLGIYLLKVHQKRPIFLEVDNSLHQGDKSIGIAKRLFQWLYTNLENSTIVICYLLINYLRHSRMLRILSTLDLLSDSKDSKNIVDKDKFPSGLTMLMKTKMTVIFEAEWSKLFTMNLWRLEKQPEPKTKIIN